jgi:anti-sigma-K factor RskA
MSTDLHSLIAPYVMDALDVDERQRMEAHLEQCTTCHGELTGFQGTAARLGEAQSQTPPAGLRARILAEASTTRQERPIVTPITPRHGLRQALPRLTVAAAFLIGAAGIGGYAVERGQARDAMARNVAITSVLAAPDASITSKTFSTGGNVRLVASPGEDAAVIVANDLAPLKSGKVYQVWMINDAGPKSQGTFRTSGTIVMAGAGGADAVAITVEPAGGSREPTSGRITNIAISP